MQEEAIKKDKRVRYYFLDVLKVLAIIFVVLYHMSVFYKANIVVDTGWKNCIEYWLRGFFAMGVPIFFFVNGALLFHRDLDMKKHCKKILKIIALTIFWAIASYIVIEFLRGENINIVNAIKSVQKLRLQYNNHIWFLYTLVILYIFFPLLKQVWDANRKIFYFFLIAIFIATIGNGFLVQFYNIIAVILGKPIKGINTNMFYLFNPVAGIYGYAIVYFMVGAICFEYKEKFNNNKARLLACIGIIISSILMCSYWIIISRNSGKLIDCVGNSYNIVFNLINVICVFTLSLSYKENKISNKVITTIGSNTLGIYLIHQIVRTFFTYTIGISVNKTSLTQLGWSIIVFVISLALSVILDKIPLVKKIFVM